MAKTRVLVVDDSALIRTLFTEILNNDPDIEVVGAAFDPYDAREKIKKLNPDVITLDIEMPKMDGISFLEKIMSLRPMPVVMVSTLTHKGAESTLRALELGAVDYIGKPADANNRNALQELSSELTQKVKVAAVSKVRSKQHIPANSNKDTSDILPFTPSNISKKKIIAIGSSTGGVEALRDIILLLPSNTPPILITQHMPEAFTASFAKRLDGLSEMTVHEATNDQKILPGNVYIAPGGKHMEIKSLGDAYACRIADGEPVSGHKPSVDVLFSSVANIVKQNAIGVILTGMGKDGAEGMLTMRQAGAYNIGQNEESCVVYGMPKAARMNNATNAELSLAKIAKGILENCHKET